MKMMSYSQNRTTRHSSGKLKPLWPLGVHPRAEYLHREELRLGSETQLLRLIKLPAGPWPLLYRCCSPGFWVLVFCWLPLILRVNTQLRPGSHTKNGMREKWVSTTHTYIHIYILAQLSGAKPTSFWEAMQSCWEHTQPHPHPLWSHCCTFPCSETVPNAMMEDVFVRPVGSCHAHRFPLSSERVKGSFQKNCLLHIR